HLKTLPRRISLAVALVAFAALHAPAAEPSRQTKFARPEDAMHALVAAVRADDEAKLTAILGPDSADLISSGDPIDDKAQGHRFAEKATERTTFETLDSGAVIAQIGSDAWPFAIPLVKDGDGWRFDTAAGRDELLNRRIGRNELKAIGVCRAFVDAQREYASRERVAGGGRAYAQKVRSDPGKRDGLYWDDPTGKEPSPFGPHAAAAAAEGYTKPE